MSPDERDESLVESTLSAFRERDAAGLPVAPPAWWDLSPQEREDAARAQRAARVMEAAIDPRGWSTTVHAVLARLV